MDSRVQGSEYGVSLDRSGDFSDIADRGGGIKAGQFTDELWYKGQRVDYDEDSQDAIVISTAEASCIDNTEGRADNAYAFARAAFDYLHKHIPYDRNAPVTARSGPECYVGMGDCDEQTNAYFSILRTKGIPGWYVFGALTDSTYQDWEGHAWGYILLPMSDDWCESRNSNLDDCLCRGFNADG